MESSRPPKGLSLFCNITNEIIAAIRLSSREWYTDAS